VRVLLPQCTALRCPWVSALVSPVVRVPSCARGPPGVLFTAHLHMYNRTVLQICTVLYCIGTRLLTRWLCQNSGNYLLKSMGAQ